MFLMLFRCAVTLDTSVFHSFHVTVCVGPRTSYVPFLCLLAPGSLQQYLILLLVLSVSPCLHAPWCRCNECCTSHVILFGQEDTERPQSTHKHPLYEASVRPDPARTSIFCVSTTECHKPSIRQSMLLPTAEKGRFVVAQQAQKRAQLTCTHIHIDTDAFPYLPVKSS